MFVAQALYSFSKIVLETQTKPKQQQEPLYSKQKEQNNDQGDGQTNLKRPREKDQQQQLAIEGNDKFFNKQESQPKQKQQKVDKKQSSDDPAYISFQKGDKILVQQTFENGWWYGNAIKKPQLKGFFPSNYVKVGAKPPPPPPPQSGSEQEGYNEQAVYEPEQGEKNWMIKQLKEQVPGEQTAISSQYYQGIKGYKYVRITDANKNILNGNYVKFDANTGLARVPVKDQAPCSKAVRQMGYYFDYHQWNQERNKNPEAHRNRPDPKKKKQKKLHLVGMGKDK